MRVPTSTYRLQLNADFKFARVTELIDYFKQLGVGDLYFSPVFQARPKSPHGYDITNPAQFNREVGDEAEFEALSRALRAESIGLLLDIVPNHMAASEENPWWRDILEHGPASLASRFFDVEWDAPGADTRIVLPVLGKDLEAAIAADEIRLTYHDGEMALDYLGRSFPLDPNTYAPLLRDVDAIDTALPAEAEAIGWRFADTPEAKEARRDAGVALKQHLAEWASVEENRVALDDALAGVDREALAGIIHRQAYKLEHWRTGARNINYRRFFDIADLAGVRVEDPAVFATTHSLILDLIRTNQIDGVRVDHVDGLRDPRAYLEDLRNAIGDEYVVVEKILAPTEELRESWPIEGTTGYDFTGFLAGFFTEPDGMSTIAASYARRTGLPPFADIVHEKKMLVMDGLFGGELRALTSEVGRIARLLGVSADDADLRAAITEVTASLSVYRTYISADDEIDNHDRRVLVQAMSVARARGAAGSAFDLLERVLLDDAVPPEARRPRLEFIINWQQFSGTVMAKGMEDTAFYTYHPLIALNEVGSHPDARIATAQQLHETLAKRARRWPYAMSASSTHDTKRSEDVRARIQVLSEMPDAWEAALTRWLERNARHRVRIGDDLFPRVNEEILIYQTLLGVWPLHESERASVRARMHAFLQKSAREAKVFSSWTDPNEEYEKALYAFTEGLLADREFMAEFAELQGRTAWFGALNSLSQLVLKLGAPGIPDIYQGNESWLFNLVDPDNRRAVDFDALNARLQSLPSEASPNEAAAMLRDWKDGRIKMHVTRAGLALRRRKLQLLANGDYVPVYTRGRFADNVFAFARKRENEWALVVSGRFYSQVARVPVGQVWADTMLDLPEGAPQSWTNVLTGERTTVTAIPEVLKTLPFALLLGDG